jgi:hypothetical protein
LLSSGNRSLDCYFRGKNRVEKLTSTLFDLRNTLASLNYYVVLSQRLSPKIQKVDISLSKS